MTNLETVTPSGIVSVLKEKGLLSQEQVQESMADQMTKEWFSSNIYTTSVSTSSEAFRELQAFLVQAIESLTPSSQSWFLKEKDLWISSQTQESWADQATKEWMACNVQGTSTSTAMGILREVQAGFVQIFESLVPSEQSYFLMQGGIPAEVPANLALMLGALGFVLAVVAIALVSTQKKHPD